MISGVKRKREKKQRKRKREGRGLEDGEIASIFIPIFF